MCRVSLKPRVPSLSCRPRGDCGADAMNHGGPPMWAIETAEEKDTPGALRSLWDRVESNLRPQEVRRYSVERKFDSSVLKDREASCYVVVLASLIV